MVTVSIQKEIQKMENKHIPMKEKADGVCGVCNERVPYDFVNKFYCSYHCCSIAYNYYHPQPKCSYYEEDPYNDYGYRYY